jgi:formylglycine-generating enzyme required for sulfatase activity
MTSNRPTPTQRSFPFACEAEAPRPAPEPQRGESVSAAVEPTALSPVSEDLMEQIVETRNMERAWKKVKANGGAPGPDGVTLKSFAQTFRDQWPRVRQQLLEGTYEPSPARRKSIPKPDGSERLLSKVSAWGRFALNLTKDNLVLQSAKQGEFIIKEGGVKISGNGIVLNGLRVTGVNRGEGNTHAGNWDAAVLIIKSKNCMVLNTVVEHNKATGIGVVQSSGITVRGNHSHYNSLNGIGGNSSTSSLVENNLVENNAIGNPDPLFEGGGGKWVQCDGITFRGNLYRSNWGPGIWIDIRNKKFDILNNVFHDNIGHDPEKAKARSDRRRFAKFTMGFGVCIEYNLYNGGPFLIEGNHTYNNGRSGIAVWESRWVTARNNRFDDGIELRAEQNRDETGYHISDVLFEKNTYTPQSKVTLDLSFPMSQFKIRNIVLDLQKFTEESLAKNEEREKNAKNRFFSSVGLVFSGIPSGTFTMGSAEYPDAKPERQVSIAPFAMNKFEVTLEEWHRVKEWAVAHGYEFSAKSPGGHGELKDNKERRSPVASVTWHDAVKWCNAQSEKDGRVPCYYTDAAKQQVYRQGNVEISSEMVHWAANGYGLPTEAEWEYAYRAGTNTRYHWGDTFEIKTIEQWGKTVDRSRMICAANSKGESREIEGAKVASTYNRWGFSDMSGNIEEWCWDYYRSGYDSKETDNPKGPASGTTRIARGGSFKSEAKSEGPCPLSAAHRSHFDPSEADVTRGLRVVTSLR